MLVYVVYGAVLGAMGAVVHWAPKLWGNEPRPPRSPRSRCSACRHRARRVPALHRRLPRSARRAACYDNGDLEIWNILVLVGHA